MSFTPVKKSAFHHKQLAIGAHMVERDGWLQSAYYSSVDRESRLLSEGAGVCDTSPTGKLLLQGDGLGDFLRNVLLIDEAPAVGEARLISVPANGRLARLTTDECLVLCETADLRNWIAALGEGGDDCVHLLDHTSGLAGVRLTGPGSGQLLSKLSELNTSPESFPNLACAQSMFAEIHGTLIRTDLGPIPSFDLFFPREFGECMWDAIFEAGVEFGVGAVGLEAADRLENCLVIDPSLASR